MNEYAGLNELTPNIIKYPFEKFIKALINLKLQRKVFKSIGTILAVIIGIAIGITFPGLGYFIVFVLNLIFATPVNLVAISGISMAVTMLLSSSLLIYMNKKIFQSYNKTKYGFSNPDLLFSTKDKELLLLILRNDDEGLSEEELKKNFSDIEDRIKFLIEKIRVFKITKQYDKKGTAKYALQCLKKGELSVFMDYYEDDYLKRLKRMDDLKKGKASPLRTNDSYTDSLGENISESNSRVKPKRTTPLAELEYTASTDSKEYLDDGSSVADQSDTESSAAAEITLESPPAGRAGKVDRRLTSLYELKITSKDLVRSEPMRTNLGLKI